MHSWNLSIGTACGPLWQVIALERLVLLYAAGVQRFLGNSERFFRDPGSRKFSTEILSVTPAASGQLETHAVDFSWREFSPAR